jgi:hypothetical protein
MNLKLNCKKRGRSETFMAEFLIIDLNVSVKNKIYLSVHIVELWAFQISISLYSVQIEWVFIYLFTK